MFERPADAFIARFIGGHNVVPWTDGLIAIRADHCSVRREAETRGGRRPAGLPGRVSNIEYQGPSIRVGLTTDNGHEMAALLPGHVYHAEPVHPGDRVAIAWPEAQAHPLAA